MDGIPTRFRAIINALRAAIGAHLDHDRRLESVFALLWFRLGRTIQRINRLYTQWQAGTLPKPRPSRAGMSRKPRPEQLQLPRARAWVIAHVGYHGVAQAGYLQQLMATPDMQEFLRAVPQAARHLRPLCHILGIDPPPSPTSPRAPGNAHPSAQATTIAAGGHAPVGDVTRKKDSHGDGETERSRTLR